MIKVRLCGLPLWQRTLPFLLIYTAYAIGFTLDVLDIDSAQYAQLAHEMLQTGQWLQLYNAGADYLDKPPLIFWTAAAAYKLLGVSVVAFRLPSFLVSLLGIYATFSLARRYYGYDVGYLAALMLSSCQAFFMFHHDVRTDTLLTGAVITAIWQLDMYLNRRRWLNLLLAFTAIAVAMLAKGPIGLMVPVLAFATHLALRRQWSLFFRPEWLVGLAWVGLLLLPMCIGLYQQFDLHPEKVMYGRTGTSGLRFFFWTQSFGRITGESSWQGQSDPFFFTHTFLWAFLPWSLFFVVALYRRVRQLIGQRFRLTGEEEGLTLGGFVLPFLALSTSRYQLPHYIFVLLPLASILAAQYVQTLLETSGKGPRIWRWIQLVIGVALWFVIGWLLTMGFPLTGALWLLVVGCGAAALYCWFRPNALSHLIGFSLWSIVGANLALNAHVYPDMFRYQSGSVAARFIRAQGLDAQQSVYVYKTGAYSFNWGIGRPVRELPTTLPNQPVYAFTTPDGLTELQRTYPQLRMIRAFDEFPVSMLRLPFLNAKTRPQTVEKRYLVQVR